MKILMEIDPLPTRGSMVMTMVTISPSRRDVSPVEQLRWSPRLVSPGSASSRRRFVPKASFLFFPGQKTPYTRRWASGGFQVAHEAGGAPRGVGRTSLHRGFLKASLTSTPSLLDCFRSKNNSPNGFILFGLRLIFLFFETLK